MYGDINLIVDGKEIQYQLSVGIDFERGDNWYYAPTLSFWKDKGLNSEKKLGAWDSDEYLLETLLPLVLVPWIERKEIAKPKDFADLLVMGAAIEDLPLIKGLLEKGIKLGFFKNKI